MDTLELDDVISEMNTQTKEFVESIQKLIEISPLRKYGGSTIRISATRGGKTPQRTRLPITGYNN